jgi:hypothetical protein
MPASKAERKYWKGQVLGVLGVLCFCTASLTSFQRFQGWHGLLSFSLWTKACRLAVPLVELLVSESLLQRRIGGWTLEKQRWSPAQVGVDAIWLSEPKVKRYEP